MSESIERIREVVYSGSLIWGLMSLDVITVTGNLTSICKRGMK